MDACSRNSVCIRNRTDRPSRDLSSSRLAEQGGRTESRPPRRKSSPASRAAVFFALLVSLRLTFPAASLVAGETPTQPPSDRQVLAELVQQITAGDLDQAAARLRQLDDEQTTGKSDRQLDLTYPLARLARALEQSGELTPAAELFGRAVNASGRSAATVVTDAQRVVLRLNAASLQLKTGQFADALASLEPICGAAKPAAAADSETAKSPSESPIASQLDSSASQPNSESQLNATDQRAEHTLSAAPAQLRFATRLLLSIGASALAKRDAVTAADAYDMALGLVEPKDLATASLGAAWAATLDSSRRSQAAKKLLAFAERFPEHADAAKATRVSANCWAETGERERSAEAIVMLLQRWPRSRASIDYVQSHSDAAAAHTNNESPADRVQSEVERWLIQFAQSDNPPSLKASALILGLIVTAREDQIAGWNFYSSRLASEDLTGQATADVLHRLTQLDRVSDAERLSTVFVAPGELPITAAAREAACRWAGRTERWTILAMASQAEQVSQPSPTRTVAVERLFAESLMQTGRRAQARLWWEHLVDEHGVQDFLTLLRCAETATALAKADEAITRIDAARQAAGGDARRLALMDMLSAELGIRRLRFDEARALLENVVRGSETPPALRGRAQWLIGESYFLQEDFAKAIEAYRVVEGIDSSDTWAAAALVQAGKSFEQLGRTREAAVCYWNLVNRFAQSVHARVAQDRLTAIAPDSSSSTETLRR